jgi:hypothetical protein
MSEYIIVEGGLVIEHCCGALQEGRDCRLVPDSFNFEPGADVRNYDEAWALRPLKDRIKDGLVVVSKAEKIIGERVIAKDALERIRDGIDKAPGGLKIIEAEDGALTLEGMTYDEQVAAKQLDASVARSLKLRDCGQFRRAAYQDEADPLFFGAQRGENTLEDWKAKVVEIKKRFPKPEEL